MNGIQLVDLLCEFGIGVVSERVTIYDIDNDELAFDFPESNEIDEESGIEIFANYKNHQHFAVYFSQRKLFMKTKFINHLQPPERKFKTECL